MTTHIEHAISEVIPQPEAQVTAQGDAAPWQEEEKIMAAMARRNWTHLRLRAEGLDD